MRTTLRRFPLAAYALILTAGSAVAGTPTIKINEIDASMESGILFNDNMEFVELYDGGVGNTSLDGLTLALYEAEKSIVCIAVSLDGFATGPDGFFVVGSSNIPNVDLSIGNLHILDDRGAVALYEDDASNFPFGTSVTVTNLVDAVVYRDSSPTGGGLNALLVAGSELPQAAYHGVGSALGRCPDGAGLARDTTLFTARPATPGGPSTCLDNPSFCTGLDGGTSQCPCAPGFIDTGCDRPVAAMSGGGTTGGVRLNLGAVSTSPQNRATVTGTGMPGGNGGVGVLFRSTSAAVTPTAFGDGLLCTGLTEFVRIGHATGSVLTFTVPHSPMAGPGTFYYQSWVRSIPISFCDPTAGFTTSSGLVLTW